MIDKKEVSTLAKKIAKRLGETEKPPQQTINRLIRVVGQERALALLEAAIETQTSGGLKTDDGERHRTLGGVFFKLAKEKLSSQERWRVFASPNANKKKKEPVKPPTWTELKSVVGQLLASEKGEASTVKITIIGRPGRVSEKGGVVLTTMQSSKSPSLPKELPTPPGEPTTYLVYISARQWRKIKDSLDQNQDDKLIVEGYPVFDRRLGQNGHMTIYAQNVTTKLLQQAQRSNR